MFGDSHYKTSAKNTFFHTVVDLPLARAAASSGSEQPPFGPITAIFLVMAESCERENGDVICGLFSCLSRACRGKWFVSEFGKGVSEKKKARNGLETTFSTSTAFFLHIPGAVVSSFARSAAC